MKKTNVLLLFTDMQRADTIHALGNPVIKTPNLDRLVKEGTAFTNCYSPSPVCIPARCSMQYGLYPHNSGCADNVDWMKDNGQSFPAILADNGYKSHAIGKLHYDPDQLGPEGDCDGLRGFQSREMQEEALSHDDRDDYIKYLKKNNYDHKEPHGYRGEMYYIPQVSTLPAEAHPTQWIGDRTVDFIEKESQSDKPWCLMSSFIHPHPPFTPPKPWHKLYRAAMMPYPKIAPYNDSLLTHTNRVQNRYKYRDQGIDNNLVRNIKAFYYATISFVDYQVGRILDQLEKSGELDNTLIIFSSDHGEFLGDYNCFGKRSMHDASSKVPLIVRYPEKFAKNAICQTPTSLIDIMPTMLASANIDEKQFDIDGVNLAEIADGSSDRKSVLSEHLLWNIKEQGQYMIANEQYKYFYSSADDKEFLFDKITDPNELKNCANNPFYTEVQQELKDELINSLKGTKLSHAVTDNEWTKCPKAELEDTPDAHLICQDDKGSVEKIEGYN